MNLKVDKFIKEATIWQNEMKELRKILLGCDLVEEFKWGKPCYTAQKNNIVIVQPFKKHLSLMFFKGALLKDSKGILRSQGENTRSALRLEFTNRSQITQSKANLKAYIKEAIEIEKKGLKVDLTTPVKNEMVEELQRRFLKDKAYQKAFEALTPGRQRGYLLHFSGAKQSKTRENRIEKCRPKVMAGKGFNER